MGADFLDFILVFIITIIVLWKSIYTIRLIFNIIKMKNIKHAVINIVIFIPYILYFYFLIEAVYGDIQRVIEEYSVLVFIFIVLTFLNIFYDFKYNCLNENKDY